MFEVGISPNDSETLFDLFKGSSNCLFSLWYIFPLNEPVVYTQNMSNFCKINQQTVSRTNIGKINNYRDTYKHGFEYSTLQSARFIIIWDDAFVFDPPILANVFGSPRLRFQPSPKQLADFQPISTSAPQVGGTEEIEKILTLMEREAGTQGWRHRGTWDRHSIPVVSAGGVASSCN